MWEAIAAGFGEADSTYDKFAPKTARSSEDDIEWQHAIDKNSWREGAYYQPAEVTATVSLVSHAQEDKH